MIGCVVVLIGFIVSMLAFCSARREEQEEAPTEPEPAPPTIEYRGSHLPILENVPVNAYDAETFLADENGYIRYPGAAVGIDVSSHQGTVDWLRVAEAGVDFVMLRVGRRGYTEGGVYPDDMFAQNIEGALAAGLKVGVYFFSQAITVEEAEEEAAYVLDAIGGYEIAYPVAFDWEPITEDAARTDGLGPEQVTRCAIAFCDAVTAAGYRPAVYFNVSQGYLSYKLDRLTDYAFWLAEYHDVPGFYYGFDLWQYTHQGSVPGIAGYVDLDLDLRPAKSVS